MYYGFAEYVAFERASNVKHEFLDGQIWAMAGGSPEHAALTALVSARLVAPLEGGPCRVCSSDLRVRVAESGLTTYPDVTVVCGPWARDPEDRNTLLNPAVVVEVLSPSTEAYDRGEKFAHYQRIPSLRTYVLVAHDRRQIEVWSRGEDDAWSCARAGAGQTARLPALGVALDVDALYDAATEPE